MNHLVDNPFGATTLWIVMGFLTILLFFSTSIAIALLFRQKRYPWLWLAVFILMLSYFMEQCFAMALGGHAHSEPVIKIVRGFFLLPDWLLMGLCLGLAMLVFLLFWTIWRYEKGKITPMSIKEATDSLPSGICCYAPGGRILLANSTMENFCQNVTAEPLIDGEVFSERLRSGHLRAGCHQLKAGSEPVMVLDDNSAWKLATQEIFYDKHRVTMILASDITELYQKTKTLRHMQQEVMALNERLIKVNQEIVALTVEREVLNAKVKLHDELGTNLLAIKRYCLEKGSDKALSEIVKRLRRNISFLKTDTSVTIRDEYELLNEMASRLGLRLILKGRLPLKEPQKHVVAVAIHECMTNTLRHAHGNELNIDASEDGKNYLIKFTNNGKAPSHPIEEKGGLVYLRALTEQINGKMTLHNRPVFTVCLELPKEVENGIQSVDCG